MDNLIKKEAKIIMQIRRTKMNKHKLRKWRRKYRHFLKIKWETYEKRAAQALDDAVAGNYFRIAERRVNRTHDYTSDH